MHIFPNGKKYRDIETNIKPQVKPHKKQVVCDGMIFNSLTDASKYLQEDFRRFSAWLLGINKMPESYVARGLQYLEAHN